jgi:hypothetical protein
VEVGMPRKFRHLAASMRSGMGIVIIAVALGIMVNAVWGPIYETYGWRIMAIALMSLGIMTLALLEEFVRPQNPYRHLDPRFSYLDAAPSGQMHSGGSGWIWNMLPPAIGIVVLAGSLAVW